MRPIYSMLTSHTQSSLIWLMHVPYSSVRISSHVCGVVSLPYIVSESCMMTSPVVCDSAIYIAESVVMQVVLYVLHVVS